MKKNKLLLLPLLVFFTSCDPAVASVTSDSTSTPIATTSSESTSEVTSSTPTSSATSVDPAETSINQSLAALDSGFSLSIKMMQSATDSTGYITYQDTGSDYALITTSEEKAVSYVTNYYDHDTGEIFSSTKPTILFGDDSDAIYSEELTCGNTINKDYSAYPDSKFSSTFVNPFASLSFEDLTLREDGTYAVTEEKARSFVTAWQYAISDKASVKEAYFSLVDGSLKTFDLQIESYTEDSYTYTLDFHADILATGNDVTIDRIQTIKDDETDKTALREAFDKVGKNFTLTFDFNETDEAGYDEPYTSKYYYDGTKIFDQYDMTMEDDLYNPDTLFYPEAENSTILLRAIYDDSSSSFDPNAWSTMNYTPISYDAHLPQLANISTDFFTANADGSFNVRDGYAPLLFSYLEPYNERRALFAESATSIVISLDEAGYPLIKLGYAYDMYGDGELSVYELTLSFSDVGSTVLPEYVTSVPILSN